jgi:hypothetical protein
LIFIDVNENKLNFLKLQFHEFPFETQVFEKYSKVEKATLTAVSVSYLQDVSTIKRPVGRPVNRPSKVTADAIYDTSKIRKYNRKRGIKSNIPVNKKNQKKKERGRPIKVDQEGYEKKSAIERFFS